MIGHSEPDPWSVLESEVSYSCPGFDIVHENVRLPDGTETDFDYLSEPESVVIIPITVERDVVVIAEWREAVKRVNLGFPAGTVESGDHDLESAAERELAEETGYRCTSLDHLGTAEPANGIADTVHHYFFAKGCRPSGKQSLDSNETIEVRTMTVNSFRELMIRGDVVDGRSIIGLFYYDARVD